MGKILNLAPNAIDLVIKAKSIPSILADERTYQLKKLQICADLDFKSKEILGFIPKNINQHGLRLFDLAIGDLLGIGMMEYES